MIPLPHKSCGIAEAIGFTLAVLAYIWWLRFEWPWTMWLLVAAVIFSWLKHRESFSSLGLSAAAFWKTFREWKLGWLAAAATLLFLDGEHLLSADIWIRGSVHAAWCGIQQITYQNMVYKRLRDSFGPSAQAWMLAGAIFAVAHLPNPVLVPATLLWGAASSHLFERLPSVPALALMQLVLSAALFTLVPWEWHHGFRVGPGYWWVTL